MANRIEVAVIEGDYADLCGLGLALALSLQLQLQDLKLSGALWSAKASASGFSVILYWPTTTAMLLIFAVASFCQLCGAFLTPWRWALMR